MTIEGNEAAAKQFKKSNAPEKKTDGNKKQEASSVNDESQHVPDVKIENEAESGLRAVFYGDDANQPDTEEDDRPNQGIVYLYKGDNKPVPDVKIKNKEEEEWVKALLDNDGPNEPEVDVNTESTADVRRKRFKDRKVHKLEVAVNIEAGEGCSEDFVEGDGTAATHEGEVCDNGFSSAEYLGKQRKTNLNTDTLTHAIELNVFKCSECGSMFGRKHKFSRHQDLQSQERSVICDTCESKYVGNIKIEKETEVGCPKDIISDKNDENQLVADIKTKQEIQVESLDPFLDGFGENQPETNVKIKQEAEVEYLTDAIYRDGESKPEAENKTETVEEVCSKTEAVEEACLKTQAIEEACSKTQAVEEPCSKTQAVEEPCLKTHAVKGACWKTLAIEEACPKRVSDREGTIASHEGDVYQNIAASSTVKQGKANLNTDTPIHARKKPFKCNECGKTFPYYWMLIRHLKIHSGERSFICSKCKKAFARKDDFERHVVSHDGERKFACPECNKKYARKDHLNKHMITHSEDRNFACPTCKKKFNDPGNLKRHRRTHSDEKRYRCNLCDYSSNDSSHLRRHEKEVHLKGQRK